MWYVYVIRSEKNGHFYKGMTKNVDARIIEHNKGYTKSTKPYIPWKIFFFEKFESRKEVRRREKYLKSGIGREYIKEKWSRSLSADR